MRGAGLRNQLRFGFYTDTFMYRSEVFFYRQAVGMQNAHVRVLARQGALLDEFPVDDLYLVDEFRRPLDRVRATLERRLDRSEGTVSRMQDYVRRRLVQHLNRHPVDLLYTIFGWHAVQLLDVLDAMQRPVPLVYFAGGSDVIAAPAFGDDYLRRLRCVFGRAELILATSAFVADRLVKMGAPARGVELLYLGVDVHDIVPFNRSLKDEEFRVLAASRLSNVKGVPHTIRAFARVAQSVPFSRLDIIGDGDERAACERLVDSLGLSDRVHFHGSKSSSDVYRAMGEADVFAQHSVPTPEGLEEAMGISILEASAHGLPVVVTRTGGVPEGVVDGLTGILIEPGDEESMAEAILVLARHPERRRRMGAAGREHMIRNFDVRKQNEKLEAILTEIALEHRRRHG